MFTQFYRHMRITAIFSLVLVFALSAAWATTNYYKNKKMETGDGLSTNIIHKGNDRIKKVTTESTLQSETAHLMAI